MSSKITKEEAQGLTKDLGNYHRLSEYSISQLPRTPGRDKVERGLETVKEGLSEIKKEVEL
jgi:hypothetical protein